MTAITIDNFEEKLPEIKISLQNAKFIGLDLEFSSLYPLKNHSPSLFDSPSERYIKLRRNLIQIVPLQIGLTAFTFNPDKNSYHGTVYNFYVIAPSFPTVNRAFYFQSDTLSFLKLHGFDFNKCIYSGIPFINRDQERELRKRLRNNEVVEKESSCFIQLEEFWKNEGDKFKSWYYKAKDGDHLVIPKLYDSHKYNFEFMYFIHKNFRCRFKNLWTTVENGQFVCEKVTEDKYRTLENDNSLEEQLITNLLGFTNVFRILTSLRKPIIGHNLLQDVLLMIDSFETSLPTSYISFKKLALNLFPVIFDTKVITYSMRKLIPEDKRWTDSSLELLFNFFKNGTGRHLVLNSPAIEIIGNSNYGVFHEAGWDSFCAGYIFIRLAYLNIYHKYPKSKRFVSSELIAGMSEWKNHVNVIRGLVSSIRLDGEDPETTRPPYLVVESVRNRTVDIPQVTSLLSSFGFVEIRKLPYDKRRALIAVDNFGNARRILNSFKAHSEFQIKQYSAIKHSPVVQVFLVSGITASCALLLWLTHSAMKR